LETIDAGLYQKWRDARSLLDYHCQELLPASLEYARAIHAPKVVIFSFERSSDWPGVSAPDEVLECLLSAAAAAQQAGVELVIEVEERFWADTGAHTAELLERIDHPALGVNWDPGNAAAAGDTPYPDGYQALRQWVRHVHFKDLVSTPGGGYQYAVDGQIDWAGQIRALAADGYAGAISVEPHLQPKVASAKASYQRLKSLIEANAGDRADSSSRLD
jgi:sugar phosphate isomerase/epimerase